MRTTLKAALLAACILASALANNVQVTNVSVTGQNVSGHYAFVEFDISWANSWRDNANWDAAWVFIKWSTNNGYTWQHALLNPTASNHTAPSGSTIAPSADSIGAFIHRSASGSGTATWSNVQLRWEYGVNGVADNAVAIVKVFAVEMVHVPEGSFYAGDSSTTYITGQFANAGNYLSPFLVSSESILTLGGTTPGNLASRYHLAMFSSNDDDFDSTTTRTLPAAFPKGYNDFYCMKYETSQQQICDFMNTLNRTQQSNLSNVSLMVTVLTQRYIFSQSTTMLGRNGLRCDSILPPIEDRVTVYCDYNGNGIGNENGDGQNIAMSYCMSAIIMAYADWAGLRPMTELEYEKACRGPVYPIPDELPWGSRVIDSVAAIVNAGFPDEASNTTGANCHFNNGFSAGPLRAGIFSTSSSSREQAGASYWGILDLAGNTVELCVSVGYPGMRPFTGKHGDGRLTTAGYANVSDWPSLLGKRGGAYGNAALQCRVSDRYFAVYNGMTLSGANGFRHVRTAP